MMARLALCLALLLCLPAPASAVPRFDTAGDWSLVCDEGQLCTITGIADLPNRPGNVRVAVSIVRDNAPEAPNYLRMLPIRWDGVPVEDAHLYGFRLAGPDGGLMLSPSGNMTEGINHFFPAESAAIIDWFVRHRPHYLLQEGAHFARLPVGDLARLLRLRDQRQLDVARVDAPPDEIELPGRAWFEIFPTERTPLDALPRAIVRRCPRATPANSPGYGIDHNTNPTLLLIVPCGAHSAIYTWFRGAPPALQRLDDPIARRYRRSVTDYDDTSGILTITYRQGRRTDCGYRARWAWVDGEGLMRLEAGGCPIAAACRPSCGRRSGGSKAGWCADPSSGGGALQRPMPIHRGKGRFDRRAG